MWFIRTVAVTRPLRLAKVAIAALLVASLLQLILKSIATELQPIIKKPLQALRFNGLSKHACSGFWKMAQRTGLEPATPGVTGRYSNRLNYRCAIL